MKTVYRGFELEANREKCLGGWEQVYYSAIRQSDRWIMIENHSDDEDTLPTHLNSLKKQVDEYFEHPERYEDEDETIERLTGELKEARALACWFFQDCVAPYGFKGEVVKALRKRFEWLKNPVEKPILDEKLRPVEG